MNKISIIGGSGTGKTTLASNLGKDLNLPVYHLDGLNYFSKWKERNKKERDELILKKISEKKWIIDGTYHSTLSERLKKADLIIYLDYSTFTQIRGVINRNIKLKGRERTEIPGCNEKIDIKYLWWVLKWKKSKRKKILNYLNEVDSKKTLIFKNRRQLNRWYKKTFNKKIDTNLINGG